MAKTVFTGWRSVTPGACSICGYDGGWDCDGRGTILCECQRCGFCGYLDCKGCSDLEDTNGVD